MFIKRQLNLALALSAAAKWASGERAEQCRSAALRILREFKRYVSWCVPYLSEADQTSIGHKMQELAQNIGVQNDESGETMPPHSEQAHFSTDGTDYISPYLSTGNPDRHSIEAAMYARAVGEHS